MTETNNYNFNKEGINNKIEELIDIFYIQNIKSVVFIDDEFPTLENLLQRENINYTKQGEQKFGKIDDPDKDMFNTDNNDCNSDNIEEFKYNYRIHDLIESSHKYGLLVDILDDYPANNYFWKKADLLVLDYFFNENGDKTINALKQLSKEPDYNLVIVYTNENVNSVANDVFQNMDDPEYFIEYYNTQKDLKDNPWIAFRNLFVLFISKSYNKEQTTIENLINALKKALVQYSPSPMVVLSHIVAMDLRMNIHENIHKMLPTREDKASALFASIYDISDHKNRDECTFALSKLLSVLFRKADAALSNTTVNHLCQLISEVKNICNGNNDLINIRNLEKASSSEKKIAAYYAHLNNFICNDPNIPSRITTGSIFYIENNNDIYYVCVSPECDLERGSFKKISAIQIETCEIKESKLKDLNSNKYILFNNNNEFKLGSIDPLKMHTKDFFMLDKEGCLKYYEIEEEDKSNDNSGLICNEKNITVIAQLRPEYSHRLMARAGAWKSRIGLDFINLPKQNAQVPPRLQES